MLYWTTYKYQFGTISGLLNLFCTQVLIMISRKEKDLYELLLVIHLGQNISCAKPNIIFVLYIPPERCDA
jgi:hypothetical protein